MNDSKFYVVLHVTEKYALLPDSIRIRQTHVLL